MDREREAIELDRDIIEGRVVDDTRLNDKDRDVNDRDRTVMVDDLLVIDVVLNDVVAVDGASFFLPLSIPTIRMRRDTKASEESTTCT
mmetsp:Transcript_24034/g.24306  ORF Transcript_24034/g.24306 Transcript_24034/m.24306 type:complete len:88 (+) Transcript_24034:755-1018(+)